MAETTEDETGEQSC